MSASREDIKRWLNDAPTNTTHVIVVTDTYDYDNYAVNVLVGESVQVRVNELNAKNMTTVEEVYSLTGKHGLWEQMNERRAYHLD